MSSVFSKLNITFNGAKMSGTLWLDSPRGRFLLTDVSLHEDRSLRKLTFCGEELERELHIHVELPEVRMTTSGLRGPLGLYSAQDDPGAWVFPTVSKPWVRILLNLQQVPTVETPHHWITLALAHAALHEDDQPLREALAKLSASQGEVFEQSLDMLREQLLTDEFGRQLIELPSGEHACLAFDKKLGLHGVLILHMNTQGETRTEPLIWQLA